VPDASLQHAVLEGPIALESGVLLPSVRVAYHAWGTLNAARDNAVVVCHALTGSSNVSAWWDGFVGEGLALDSTRDFVVCSNVIGSCYGTTGPGAPEWDAVFGSRPEALSVTVRDQVAVQRRWLDQLGVRRIRLVIGGSMGGMQALEWALMAPDMVEAIAVLAAPAVHHAWALALSATQRQAIFADAAWPDGDAARGLAVARMMAMCSYRSPLSLEARFARAAADGDFDVSRWLRRHGDRLVERFTARTYVALSHALDSHDVGRGRGGVRAALARLTQPAFVLGITTDVLYPPHEMQALADALPAATLSWLDSPHGHDAFLIELAEVSARIKAFRASVETPRAVPRPLLVR
jgi:homoserine O-acetyltransferase/O-succinyltransferase